MYNTERLVAAAKRGDSDRLLSLLDDPQSIDFSVKINGDNLLHLIAKMYVGEQAELKEILLSIYSKMKQQNPNSEPLAETDMLGQTAFDCIERHSKIDMHKAIIAAKQRELDRIDLDLSLQLLESLQAVPKASRELTVTTGSFEDDDVLIAHPALFMAEQDLRLASASTLAKAKALAYFENKDAWLNSKLNAALDKAADKENLAPEYINAEFKLAIAGKTPQQLVKAWLNAASIDGKGSPIYRIFKAALETSRQNAEISTAEIQRIVKEANKPKTAMASEPVQAAQAPVTPSAEIAAEAKQVAAEPAQALVAQPTEAVIPVAAEPVQAAEAPVAQPAEISTVAKPAAAKSAQAKDESSKPGLSLASLLRPSLYDRLQEVYANRVISNPKFVAVTRSLNDEAYDHEILAALRKARQDTQQNAAKTWALNKLETVAEHRGLKLDKSPVNPGKGVLALAAGACFAGTAMLALKIAATVGIASAAAVAWPVTVALAGALAVATIGYSIYCLATKKPNQATADKTLASSESASEMDRTASVGPVAIKGSVNAARLSDASAGSLNDSPHPAAGKAQTAVMKALTSNVIVEAAPEIA